ncbi:hypothetical protein PJI16_14885 [Nitrospira sp. MA-1]|nr:hypothetical protein [Nitrospira sp. MA-1]
MMHHSNRVTKVLFVAEDVSDHITDHHVSLRKKNLTFDDYDSHERIKHECRLGLGVPIFQITFTTIMATPTFPYRRGNDIRTFF